MQYGIKSSLYNGHHGLGIECSLALNELNELNVKLYQKLRCLFLVFYSVFWLNHEREANWLILFYTFSILPDLT